MTAAQHAPTTTPTEGNDAMPTASPDLRAEILRRLATLPRGRSHTPSVISRADGPPLGVTPVWRELEAMWEDDLVAWTAEAGYSLPEPSEAAPLPLTFDGTGLL